MQEGLVYADGSSIGNPGPGGWGAIILKGGMIKEIGGGERKTTNNRMELTAAIEALQLFSAGEEVELRTDSKYLVQGASEWVLKWKANGWKTAGRQEVLNKDLWLRLDELVSKRDTIFKYVEAHRGVPGNERADEIAEGFARGGSPSLYVGPREAYSIDLMKTKTKPFYVSFAGGVFGRHASWGECEAAVRGVSGSKFKKIYSDEEAQKTRKIWENDER